MQQLSQTDLKSVLPNFLIILQSRNLKGKTLQCLTTENAQYYFSQAFVYNNSFSCRIIQGKYKQVSVAWCWKWQSKCFRWGCSTVSNHIEVSWTPSSNYKTLAEHKGEYYRYWHVHNTNLREEEFFDILSAVLWYIYLMRWLRKLIIDHPL